jgi:hypothetical protein
MARLIREGAKDFCVRQTAIDMLFENDALPARQGVARRCVALTGAGDAPQEDLGATVAGRAMTDSSEASFPKLKTVIECHFAYAVEPTTAVDKESDSLPAQGDKLHWSV